MAMVLCSSRLAAVRCYLRLCQIQRRDSRLAVPVILGVSAGFRQFPPSVCTSASHGFRRRFRVSALSALSAVFFRSADAERRIRRATRLRQSADSRSAPVAKWAGLARAGRPRIWRSKRKNMMSAFAVTLNYLSNNLDKVKQFLNVRVERKTSASG